MYKIDKNTPIHWHGNCLEIRLLPLDDKVHDYGTGCEIVFSRLFVDEPLLERDGVVDFINSHIENGTDVIKELLSDD